MNKCLNCGAELKQIEGSREKKYCNDICRASYHQKKNRGKEPQYVKYSTFKELKDKFDKLSAGKEVKVADLNKPTDQIKDITKEMPKTNYTINAKNNAEQEYDFSGKSFLVMEDYTLYPTKNIPKNQLQAQVYLKEKKEADDKIRVAWNKFKNNDL